MAEEKKSSGAGKFVLGAAIGAFVGAIAGKLLSTRKRCEECSDEGESDEDSADGEKKACDCGCQDGDKKHETKAKAK